ncbi:MAG: extracellular solute-binding protein [Vallitaleaceae bacterium]|nr:extracellular solute-binding protein [Vallitaleaceae bacterium]
MKKVVSILLAMMLLTSIFAGCSKKETEESTTGSTETTTESGTESSTATEGSNSENAEIVDGKFVDTRKITVEVFDRGNDGGSAPEDNPYTDFIKEGMLRDHNVEVEFVTVPRWTEVEQINNLLAAADAPDVCVTYSYPTVQTYAEMGGVLDMAQYLEPNKELLPNLYGLLGEENLTWNKDPKNGTIWAIEARLAINPGKNVFVRQDWLDKLGMKQPTTTQEFEDMLVAFKENASTLLGAEADKMIPFSLSFDIGWRAFNLVTSYLPDDLTDKDYYVYGFDDRQLLLPNAKEGIRKLNEWYNKGLIWSDFALYGAGDTTEGNLMKAGYVGSYSQNWDDPYRGGDDSIHNNLQRLVGEDAMYVAIETFQNESGEYKQMISAPVDRKVFFPSTNDEPLASLLYLDWISKLENRIYLQIGEEGRTHEVLEDGTIKTIAATDEYIMNSPSNIDYTITNNGLDLGDMDKTIKAISQGYVGVQPEIIDKAFRKSPYDYDYVTKNANAGPIAAEDGMGAALSAKRDTLLVQAVVAPLDQFDAVYDAGYQDYLSSGGQAIIDERTAAWEAMYGDKVNLD